MAKHLGMLAMHAAIHKIEPRDVTEKEWVGSVKCMVQGVPAKKRILVAVAGLVAEACWKKETVDDLGWELSAEEMSQADWKLAGCLPGEPSRQVWNAVERAFELLNRDTGKLWKDLLSTSRRLIVDFPILILRYGSQRTPLLPFTEP